MVRIMAIDQAISSHAGFAVVEFNERLESPSVLFTTLETYDGIKRGAEYRRRLVQFGRMAESVFTKYNPDYVITEKVRTYHGGHPDPDVMKLLSQAQGMLYAVIPLKRPLYVVNTSSWKLVVLGSGKASKEAARIYVAETFDTLVTDHEADAICMALYLAKVRMQEKVHVLEMC